MNGSETPPGDRTMRLAGAGHAIFAATMIALGLLGLIKGNFTVIWQPVPKGVPAREALVYVCASISVGCGMGLLWRRTAALAARTLFVYMLFWFLVFRVPSLFHSLSVDVYWSVCKTGVIVAASWVLFAWFTPDWHLQRLSFGTDNKGLRIARRLYGLSIMPFGLAHFQYIKHTADLVPRWLPAHVAWAYLTGAAFILAGLAMVVGVYGRLAATLSALEMGMFLVLVWVPVAATSSMNTFQWGETIVSWVLTAAAWVVADSYRGVPWLAVNKAASGATAGSLTL